MNMEDDWWEMRRSKVPLFQFRLDMDLNSQQNSGGLDAGREFNWSGSSAEKVSSSRAFATTSQVMENSRGNRTSRLGIQNGNGGMITSQSSLSFRKRGEPEADLVDTMTRMEMTRKGERKVASVESSSSSWTEGPRARSPSPTRLSDFLNSDNGRRSKTKKQSMNSGKCITRTTECESAGVTPSAVAGSSLSVLTQSLEDPHVAGVAKLCNIFPSALQDEVERIYNLYEGNLDFCASALAEHYYPVNDEQESVEIKDVRFSSIAWHPSQPPGKDCSTEDTCGAAGNANSLSTPRIDYASRRSNSSCTESEDEDTIVGTNNESKYFEMTLPTDFAKTLLTAYGHPDDESRVVSKDELKIKVSPEIAFELYKSLYLNIHRASEEKEKIEDASGLASVASSDSDDLFPESYFSISPASASTCDGDFNEVEMFNSIREMEAETSSGDPSLPSIMKIESKLSYQMQEKLKKYSAPNRTMAQQIHFQTLTQRYSHLGADLIDEIFCQYELNVDKTESFLNEMYEPASSSEKSQPPVSDAKIGDEKGLTLKYSPKDVKNYSVNQIEGLKSLIDEKMQLQRNTNEIASHYYQCFIKERDPRIGAYYYRESRRLSDLAYRYSEEAQYYTAIAQNVKQNNDNNLDLHGLSLSGAMRVLEDFLEFKEEEFLSTRHPKKYLLIITGQGKHSRNGIPVLQPEVGRFLKANNYRVNINMPGTYTVTLIRDEVVRKKKQQLTLS